ncbi:hypothetical protein IJ674_10445 [bacterium]|nr:hypothetical protein [bacterium]
MSSNNLGFEVESKFGFIEDKNINKFDFVEDTPNNKFDFQPDNIPSEKPKVLEGKIEYNKTLTPYDAIQNDNTLTKEEKVAKIKEIGEAERKRIDREYRINMAKLYGGAALEIGSAAIPFGGAARVGGALALKVAKPAFSQIAKKVVAKNIGSGIGSGLASGAVFGLGEGLMENKDLKGIGESTVKGTIDGGLFGGAIGGVAGKIATKFGRTKDVIEKSKSRIPLSRNQVEDAVRNLVHQRRANIDSAKFDAVSKINNLISEVDKTAKELKVNPKNLREVLTFLRENKGLPTKNFNRQDLIKLFNSLDFNQRMKLKELAQKHFEDMEVFWNNLADVKGIKSGVNPYDYITHMWELDDPMNIFSEGVEQAVKDYLRTKSQFELRRIIPTYKKGIEEGLYIPSATAENGYRHINLRPKTLDYAEIQKTHADQLIESAENTRFLKEISKLVKNNQQYSKQIYKVADLVLKPKDEKIVENFGTKLFKKIGSAYDTVNNFAKGCKFLFNGMHAVALTESAAAHEGLIPFRTFKTLGNLPKIIDGIKNNNYELFKNTPLAKQAIKDGVQFGAISDINIKEFNTFIDGFTKLVNKVTLGTGKILTTPLKTYVDINNKFLWNYLHNTYKLHAYDSLIKRASKNGKITLSDNVRKDIAQLVNDTFGGQNWETLGFKPTTVQTARRLMLSPDWNMSATLRQSLAVFSTKTGQKFLNAFAESSGFGSAVREISRKVGLSSFTNDVEGAGIRGKLARGYFMTFLIQTAIYSNIINAINRQIDFKNNPDKYSDGINYSSYSNNRFTERDNVGKKVVETIFTRPYVGNDEKGREIYARIGKQALEVPELVEDLPNSAIRKLASKSAPLINPVVTKLADDYTDNWNKASIKDRYKDTFTPFTVSGSKKGFHPMNIFYSTSKGLNYFQAHSYIKEKLLEGDIKAIEQFKPKVKANGINYKKLMKRIEYEIRKGNYEY